LATAAQLHPPSCVRASGLKLLVTCHRRESWGSGLRSIAEALGISSGTVAATLNAAHAAIRTRLEGIRA